MTMGETHARVSQATVRRRVRFYETDAAGIVHFSVFFRFMEEAECELWRSAGLRNSPTRDLSFPRVAASFDFRKPLRFDDEFEARIQIAELRTKAIRYECDIIVAGEVAATGSMTIVCATAVPGQPVRAIAIPDSIAARFEVADAMGSRP